MTATTYDPWYTASDQPELVEFGTVHGLGTTGRGEPGGPAHMESIEILYAVAGKLLGLAAQAGAPFPMPTLEGFWWVEDDRPPFQVPRTEWCWRLFMRIPDDLPTVLVDQAREAVRTDRPAAARVQLVTTTEGECVQMMHRGPFAEEPRTLAAMDEFMSAAGLRPNGLHHEIYLTGLAATEPENLRTILRQPVKPH
jgi:hypothetical protein